jgi:ABC-type Fe3+-hydroxamate transport system substrate-binding protein
LKVVSLVPSITETLLAWGIRPVGVTRFCEAPGLTQVGGTKNPDLAAIVALAPDVVVMDKEENRSADAEALQHDGVAVHVTQVRALADVAPTLTALAAAVGVPAPAWAEAPGQSAPGVRAWVPIWRRPWMSIGGATYGSSLLAAAGIGNVCQGSLDPYPTMTLEEATALDPDVVLAPSEPYAFAERHRVDLEKVAPVVFVDGQDLFWWGSRTPSALQRLKELAAGLALG